MECPMSDQTHATSSHSRGLSFVTQVPGVAGMLVLLIVLFSAAAGGFATTGNMSNILLQSVILLTLALPMTLIIMTEGLDLSMGAVLTLASVVLATATGERGSVVLALLIGISIGAVFGLLNGVLVAIARIPPFVATLGTLGIAQGLANVVTDGQSVTDIPAGLSSVYAASIFGIPLPIWIGAIAYLAF